MVPQWRHKGGYAPALRRMAQEKKLIKLLMPNCGFRIMYYPSFIQKENTPPTRLRDGSEPSLPQKLKKSKIQLKIKIQTSNFGFLVMDHPSFIPDKNHLL